MTATDVSVREFAERVERLCDFLLDKYQAENDRDGSADLQALEDLKEDAADLSVGGYGAASDTLDGLADALRCLPPTAPKS